MAHNSYLISISDLAYKYLFVIRKRASRTGLRKFLGEKVNFSNVKRRTDEPAFFEINLRNENKVQWILQFEVVFIWEERKRIYMRFPDCSNFRSKKEWVFGSGRWWLTSFLSFQWLHWQWQVAGLVRYSVLRCNQGSHLVEHHSVYWGQLHNGSWKFRRFVEFFELGYCS